MINFLLNLTEVKAIEEKLKDSLKLFLHHKMYYLLQEPSNVKKKIVAEIGAHITFNI